MTLEPFVTDAVCRMCAYAIHGRPPRFRYCESQCVGDGTGRFVEASRHGDRPTPHHHRTCERCGYEWLTKVWEPQ